MAPSNKTKRQSGTIDCKKLIVRDEIVLAGGVITLKASPDGAVNAPTSIQIKDKDGVVQIELHNNGDIKNKGRVTRV